MNYGKVEICGIDTNSLEVMKEAEKIALVKLAQAGDKQARDRLVTGNLRLVLSVIQRFLNRKELPDDLFQVGCIGLIKSIDNFDVELGVRFSTYAVPMIIGELRRFMRDSGHMRVSRSVRDLAYRSMQCREKLQNKLSRDPTIRELADELGEEISSVVMAYEASVDPISIYEPAYSDAADGMLVLDGIRDAGTEEDWISEIGLKQAMQELSRREKTILWLRYMQGKTQVEVADKIGISQAQVSRLEKCALAKIKEKL